MLSISPAPIRVGALVERAIKMFEADLASHDIKVATMAIPSLEHKGVDWVQCDPSRMTQIIVNLVTNAIKFTKDEMKREISIQYGATASDPRKTFPRNITWAPNHKGRKETRDLTLDPEWGNGDHLYLCIQVSDTGVGMSQSEIKKLFTRFEQAGSRTSIRYGGSGLGLFISHRLTEKQCGEIGVASVPNQGSTFAVYVKARGVDPERVPQTTIGLRSQSSSKPCSVSDGFVLDKMHVLLVEDNIVNQKVLQKQLTKAGCTVHIANHGVEALEFLPLTDVWHQAPPESTHLDVILMDWEMPVMDGLTCTREIRLLQKAGKIVRHIRIIGTTANARDEQIQTAVASGIDYVMSKPFVVSDLLSKMREQLTKVGD